jgi:5-formyltetrahydrofolate cyclo-ligase
MALSKDELRSKYAGCAPPPVSAGKIAERLRRVSVYRDAKTVLIMPSPLLFQARINCLLDGKVLLMPSPAIKSGFYRVKPFSVGFPDLAYGTSLKGITLFGKKMQPKSLQKMEIDLALTGCTAIDQQGNRLGEGTGFFDLSMGMLAAFGAVTDKTVVGCVAGEKQISQDGLVCDVWDVGMDFLVLKDQDYSFERQKRELVIYWDVLMKNRIRRIEPLWNLYCELFPLENSISSAIKQ